MRAPRPGLTLIELLIVLLLIGGLAVIAIPRYSRSREQAYFSAMKSDLKNLVTAQEIYYSLHSYNYAGNAGLPAAIAAGLEFAPSQGVGVTFREATQYGWSADATHAGLNSAMQRCAIFINGAAALTPAVEQGLVTCMGEP